MAYNITSLSLGLDMFKQIVALRDIAKIEKSEIFVSFENEVLYDDFFCPQVF